jgi:hypothetical protein
VSSSATAFLSLSTDTIDLLELVSIAGFVTFLDVAFDSARTLEAKLNNQKIIKLAKMIFAFGFMLSPRT